jgi:hypothetical protein
MVALSDYGDWFEMGMAIQRYSLLKDPDQILAILNAYGQYVNFVKAPERGRGELDAKKSALGALIAPERGAGLSDEEIVALYVAAFGPESYIGVTLRNQIPFDLGCFRGGRGANWFLKEVRRQLGLMGIGGHDLAMNMFPGATDDGRSWLLASLMFHSPGMPDIGKCLMDGALDGELAAILGGTRFSNIASLANFNKTFAGQATQGEVVPSAIRMAQYGQVSQKNAPKVKAINGYVAAFNRRLDEMRKGGMAVAEAKEILVHTLTELRECILQDKTKAEPEKVWGAFVGNILAYFAKSHPEMVQRNGEGAIIGLTDTTLWEMLNPTRNQGHLLCDLRLDPEERVLALEEKLEHVLNQLIRDGKEQIVRDLLYAEFCANVEIPKYDMPLRSMTLVGAQICFNEAIDALPGGTAPSSALLTLSKPAPDHPDGFLSPEERAEIDGEISILIEAGSTSADIAWYLTIREMETFLDVQGRVHPVTLRRYHLAGLAYQTDKNGTPTTRIQFLPSEDAYNEIPKVGPFQKTVIRERPVLDAAQKEALRKAINDGDIQGVIEVLVPSEKVAPNPLAEIALRNSRLLLMFPTTLVSNIGSAILTPEIGAAVKDNKVALMIYIHNALFENDPPGTTAATMMEDLYRFLSVQHRADLQAEKGTSEPDWDMVADYMTYVLLREPALYTAYESHYVPSDRDGVRERTGDKVSAVGLDVEDPKMSSKGRFLAPPLIRAVLQLNQFKELGFGIMSDGTISAFSDSHPGPVVDDPQGLSGIVAKNWSRLTGLPIQDAARFGDDAGMPGEGDLTPQNVFPQAVQADDRAEAIDGTRYLLDIDASGELAAGDSSVETLEEAPVSLITSDARDAKVEIVGIADGFIRTRYTMAMVGSVKVDALARSSDHMLSVEKGSIRIVDRTGKFLRDGDGNIITLKSGDRKMVSAGLGEYTLVSTDDEARVYTGHIPQGPEKTIVKTFQTAKAYSAKLNGEKIDYIMPKEAFRGDEKRDLEQVLRIKLGIDARIITFNSEVGFSDIRAGSLRADARQVLLGTVANYENADTETGVEGAILLKAVKLPALPDVSGLRENGMYYNLEMLAAGSVLSAVRVVDKKVDKKDLEQLGVLFSQFTGRAVGASDIYFMMSFDEVKDTDLLPADQRSIQAVVNFIKGLLMNMPAMPVDARAELESRRQALWSA